MHAKALGKEEASELNLAGQYQLEKYEEEKKRAIF